MCLKIDQMKVKKELNISLGINEQCEQEFLDLNKARHVLIAGKTGSGKSTFLHKIIKHLTENYSKDEVRLFLIDLKQTEFIKYSHLNNLYKKVATDYGGTIFGLYDILDDLEDRKEKFEKNSVFTIEEYNALSLEKKLPNIVIIIDEASILLGENKEGTQVLKWLAAQGHGVGVHLIIATQMVSLDLLVPELKANLQTRVCFSVCDEKDSFLIVHSEGAKKLKTGEFLYKSPNCNKITKYKIEV